MKYFWLVFLFLILAGCDSKEETSDIPETLDAIKISEVTEGTQPQEPLIFCDNRAILKSDHFELEFPAHEPTDTSEQVERLLTSFVVKEPAGKQAVNYPISMVFPMTMGEYFYVGDFHIKDSNGDIVPAQFNVLNRWWGKDRSLRHVQAHFNVSLPAYVLGDEGSGIDTFYLYAGANKTLSKNAVCTTELDNKIQITNGLISLDIQKYPLVINTPSGSLKSILTTEEGLLDESFNHDNIVIELEEVGPQRTVIKLSSKTVYISPKNIKHGWALRLYVHADSYLVKAEFQLQNSAINTIYSAPMYFKNHHLTLDNSGSTQFSEIKAERLSAQKIQTGESGYLTSPHVNVFIRDFWQRFPNGIKTSLNGSIHIELYPNWSKQFLNKDFVAGNHYWLDDMKQTYKEVLFDFSTQRQDSDIERIAYHFQYPPVATIPQKYYQETQVTLELGGFFPLSEDPVELSRLPRYKTEDINKVHYFGSYLFGQNNFGLDLHRKTATSQAGGTPYSNRKFFISGNPKDYYFAQSMAKAEINIRPQWLSGYSHVNNFTELKLSANPYAGTTWRKFIGHGVATSTREYKKGTKQVANPRDDQHAWFFHVEQAYLMSGNKWLKDWYEFMAEFKQVYLQELDPWPDRSNRSEGHNLNIALAAYRVTGNKPLGNLLSNYPKNIHSKYLLAPHNISVGSLTKKKLSAAVFQQGYLVKAFIDLYYEFPEQQFTVSLIKNYVDWNHSYANYSYYRNVLDYDVSTTASGTGISFVDVAMWYALYSGESKYAEHAINYLKFGIGGVKPYGKWRSWQGQYEGQIYHYYLQHNK